MAAVLIVPTVVLDADTCTGALAENRAYDRVHSEILADRELAAGTVPDFVPKVGGPGGRLIDCVARLTAELATTS